MNITIGENIKKHRKIGQVTQETLAEALGVTPQAISRWEAGNGYPAIEYLPDLASFFGVSVDELLGLKLSEREAKRENVYMTITHIEECGYNPSVVDFLREAHAEFPGDRNIKLALAKSLASTMFDEEVEKAFLKEAEKILRDLIKQADDYDFKFSCIKELAIIYKQAWGDEHGYEEVLKMLPSIDSCREIFITDFYNGANQSCVEVKECILTLARRTTSIIRDYVAYSIPNGEDKWDEKIEYLYWLIDICVKIKEILSNDEALALENNISVLYRYIATYYVAQGKYDNTLDCLEKMCNCLEKVCDYESDGKTILRSETPNDLGCKNRPHNFAWYVKPCLNQDRYDCIREMKRFKVIVDRMNNMAK